jgi:predicted deacetylase
LAVDARPLAAPIERDAAADDAALEALRKQAADEIMAAAAREEAQAQAAKAALDTLAAETAELPLPPVNVFMHGYRQIDEAEAARLRRLKDLALLLWTALHETDGTSAEQTEFRTREFGLAALRLEEAMLWIEKGFNV